MLHESDQTVGGTTVPQDTLSGSRYQQCPGCPKHVPKRALMHHIATECMVCMTLRRTGYSLMMQRELAGLGEAWRQRGLH